MVTKLDISKEGLPAYRVEGSLSSTDYDTVLPELERLIAEKGTFSIYLELVDFGGWSDLEALIKELKFDAKHGKAIKRCAIVGDSKIVEWGTKASALFFSGMIRFYPKDKAGEARAFVGL